MGVPVPYTVLSVVVMQVFLFLNPSQVNSALQDSLTPEAMEESVRILDYKTIKGIPV